MNKLLEPTEEMIEAGQIAGNLQYAKVIRSYEAMISKSETIPKLLAVLKFYADRDNYLTISAENPTPNVVMDDGDLAREALKALEE